MPVFTTQRQNRLVFAAATALVGVIVALAMTRVGGPNARYIPGGMLYVVALIGAGVAGYLSVGAFGRTGWSGWGAALLGGVGMTFLGAAIGAALLWQPRFFISGPFLGIIAIVDAAESPAASAVWGLCMTGLQVLAIRLRVTRPFVWFGRKQSD